MSQGKRNEDMYMKKKIILLFLIALILLSTISGMFCVIAFAKYADEISVGAFDLTLPPRKIDIDEDTADENEIENYQMFFSLNDFSPI